MNNIGLYYYLLLLIKIINNNLNVITINKNNIVP
jgi:hypothetical protein